MSEIDFTSMIFPENHRTTGWLTKFKKALYKMRTSVDSFSLLVFLNAGREAVSLTRPLPRTDSLSGCLLEASLTRTAPHSLLEAPSLGSQSSSPISGSRPYITGTNLLDDDSFLSKEVVCLSTSVFSATRSVSGADVAMLEASTDNVS